MTTITVDTLSDIIDENDGVTSLREALILANANPDADTIIFDATLAGETLQLTGELSLETDITIDGDIDGDGVSDINIVAAANERVFNISQDDTDVVLESLNISGGYAVNSGGNIFAEFINSLTINNSTISGGVSGIYGGNIHAREVNDLTIFQSSLLDGSAGYYGGGLAVDIASGQNFSFAQSLASNNTVVDSFGVGGGVYIFGATPGGSASIIGSTITGNYASTGGGVSTNATDINVDSSTIVGNTSFSRGGGINLDENDTLIITNSVVAENISLDNLDTPDVGGESDVTAANSFFGTTVVITTDNGGNINAGGDAGLGALGDQGGATQTLLLELGSALIGAGNTAFLPADIFDLDSDGNVAEAWSRDGTGNSRVVETLDIGASEYTLAANVVVSTLSDENDGDYSVGDLSLREALFVVRDGGTVTFDASLMGGTITLTDGALLMPRSVTIDGDINADNAADITLSGANTNGILELLDGSHILRSLNFIDGNASDGGALHIGVEADVLASDLSFMNNSASYNGGAIYNAGTLSLINAALGSNIAAGNGGAVYNTGALTFVNTSLVQNQAGQSGGAVFAGGEETFSSSTLALNSADTGGGLFDSQAAATLTNSIVIGNNASTADADISGLAAQLIGGNIVGTTVFTGSSITGTATAEAVFGSNLLSDNGGTVQTLNLISGSAAQGAGDLSVLPIDSFDIDSNSNSLEPLPRDANGESRSDDGALDLGAAEYIGPEFEGALSDGIEDFTLSEHTAQDTTLYDVNANDGFGGAADAGVTYSIVSGNSNGAFGINSATGIITLIDAGAIDVETAVSQYTLVVQVDNDASENSLSTASVIVAIEDVAENFVVTTLSDVVDENDGLLSLREALTGANNGEAMETISFDPSLAGGTLTLSAPLGITEDITLNGDINGDNRADISISGAGNHTIFELSGTTTNANLLSLTLADGENNGAVYANDIDSLFIQDSTIENSNAAFLGGGISSDNSDVTLVNSLVTGNDGSGAGGIYFDGGALMLVNSFIVDNTSSLNTGGIHVISGNSNFVNSTIANNTGATVGGVEAVGAATFTNTALSGNSGTSGNNDAQAGNLVATHSFFDAFVSIGFDNGGNLNGGGDAGLTALFDRGATTFTLGHGANSPLIDAGLNAALPNDAYDIDGDGNTAEVLPLDGRGARIQNGTTDIGASELAAHETLNASDNAETIVGSDSADTVYALGGNDQISGNAGNDTIYGGNGNDYLRGNAGDDYLDGGFGADILRGGAGADILYGGAGTDVADYTTSGGAVGVTVNLHTNINTGGDAQGDTLFFIDRVNGSSRADNITGNDNVNYLRGFAQDDVLIGGAGNDYLQGDAGADTLDGGAGTNDWAYYASSTVGITVNLGDTALNTGEAIGDVYINIENLLGSRHDDNLTGDASNNFVRGLQGNDALHGNSGNDFLRGDQGADLHDGGAGVDWAYYATSSSAVTINLNTGTASGGDAAGDTFISIERVYGSSFSDTLTGDSGANYLRGSFGNDTLNGGDGSDFLQGDSGADVLNGGAGSDWAYYASAGTSVTVNLGNSSANQGEAIGDSYLSIENVVGGRFNDIITGDSGNNTLRGFIGDDILNGGAGDDILRGEAGADTFVFEVGTGTDAVIDYNDGDDLLDFSDFGVANALDYAQQIGEDVVFTFGADVITIEDAVLAELADNII